VTACLGAVPPGAKPTEGDDTYYDSDDDDQDRVEAALSAKRAGQTAVEEGWGERAEDDDGWGMTGAKALAAKKAASHVANNEGRLIPVQASVLCPIVYG
jgi:hypothetical protein